MATGQIQVTPAGIVIVAEGVAITISGALDTADALGAVEVELSNATSPGGSKPGNIVMMPMETGSWKRRSSRMGTARWRRAMSTEWRTVLRQCAMPTIMVS